MYIYIYKLPKYIYPLHGFSLAHHSNNEFITAGDDRNSFELATTPPFALGIPY
jgi:hypothetical protein